MKRKLPHDYDTLTSARGHILINVDLDDTDVCIDEIEAFAPPAEVKPVSEMSDDELNALIAVEVWTPATYPQKEN